MFQLHRHTLNLKPLVSNFEPKNRRKIKQLLGLRRPPQGGCPITQSRNFFFVFTQSRNFFFIFTQSRNFFFHFHAITQKCFGFHAKYFFGIYFAKVESMYNVRQMSSMEKLACARLRQFAKIQVLSAPTCGSQNIFSQ